MMRKRIMISLGLAVSVMLALSGCGNKTDSPHMEDTEVLAEDVTKTTEVQAGEATEATEEAKKELTPLEAFSYTKELGSHQVTVELVKLDNPLYSTSTSLVGAAYRDGKAYVATDNSISIYDISGNTGKISNTIEYEGTIQEIDVGKDGTMYLNGGVFGATPVMPDGTVGDKVSASGELDISLDGSFGMTFFSSRTTGTKVTVNGTTVDELSEITFPELRSIYCISAGDNEIIVGGKMADEDVSGIAVYDADGKFKYKVNDVPTQGNYIDVCATETGVIGVTPGIIGFGDKEGNTFEMKTSEFTDDSIWPLSITEAEDGSVMIAGSVYQTTGEIVFLKVTGF